MNGNQTRFGDTLEVPLRNGIYKPKQFHGRGAKIVNMGELFAYPPSPKQSFFREAAPSRVIRPLDASSSR